MRSVTILIYFCVIISKSIYCANNRGAGNLLQQLQNRCLTHQPTTQRKDKMCITQNGIKMEITKNVEDGVFYCLTYKKITGNYNNYDVLTIELNPDYDLQYVSIFFETPMSAHKISDSQTFIILPS
jgi:hypothetical protein